MIMELPYQPGLSTSGLALIFCHIQPKEILTATLPLMRAKTTDEQHQKIKLKVLEFDWEKYDD